MRGPRCHSWNKLGKTFVASILFNVIRISLTLSNLRTETIRRLDDSTSELKLNVSRNCGLGAVHSYNALPRRDGRVDMRPIDLCGGPDMFSIRSDLAAFR